MSFPNNFYSFEKLASERLLLAANTQYNIPYLILRPFNIIGHDGTERIKKSTHVIPDLIKKIKSLSLFLMPFDAQKLLNRSEVDA
jgi:nucleoside-diphosphate-sugar epimerase